MTFARLILAASINEPISRPSDWHLPPRAAAMALVQCYIDGVYSLYPAFPETSLFNALDAVYQTDGRAVADFEYWLLYMALSIGAMSQSRSSLDGYYNDGVTWVAYALQYADKVLVPGYVMQMQALILLVQYSMLDPAHFDSWQLIGFACRALVDLGFHQDPPRVRQSDKSTLDLRRRMFYCLYSLDRSISMVHARPFSFTDDTTSVAFPTLPPAIAPITQASSLPGPQSLHSAVLLFQLRGIQSSWYQELFQSSRDPFQQSSTYIWRMCHEMRSWFETLPKTLPSTVKDMFELELLYSYTYCLAPSCRVPAVSELGKTLIFEYSMSYAEKIHSICKEPVNTAFYTYHDALRVYFIGSQFMAVLQDNIDQLLNARVPYIPAVAGGPPLPDIPNLGRSDNINRSIKCINQIVDTLKTYGERWCDSQALKTNFEAQVGPLLVNLHQREHQQSTALAGSHDLNITPGLMTSGQLEGRISDNWAGMVNNFPDRPANLGGHPAEQQGYPQPGTSYHRYPQ
ncbi:MAG: hypothetical protein M1818_005236 [Claussenomyces sp. TS43310]|nr:MAG: hypothetical protein M1818_005236 [Claussenomyces sp. TS43310]